MCRKMAKAASLFSQVGIPYLGHVWKRFLGGKPPAHGNTRFLLGSYLCRQTWPGSY